MLTTTVCGAVHNVPALHLPVAEVRLEASKNIFPINLQGAHQTLAHGHVYDDYVLFDGILHGAT
jgi:hypothetical protein